MWTGGTEYGVSVVFLNKIVCFVLCVTLFLFVVFSVDLEFSHTLCLCHIVLICVELKFITHARIEDITHARRMLRVFYTVAAVNIVIIRMLS
jgi:hypothetical protein